MVAVAVQAGRTAPELLTWSRSVVDPPMRAAVATLPESTGRLVEYHFGWRDAAGRPADEYPGKAVRPLLALLAAEAAGAPAASAVPAAVAVELVHNFSLIHDDIMDGDHTRRHRPTLWTVHGVGPAILAGDAMLALAYQVIAPAGLPLLSSTVQHLLDGQVADVAFEQRADVTVAECTTMAEGKTGALLAAAASLGALGAPAPTRDRLARFGALTGLAFQFADDLLGIWGDPDVTGKPVRSDLHRGKKSLPVVAALTGGTPAGARLASFYATTLSDPDAVLAAELVEASGSRAWCQARADELFAEAVQVLTEIDMASRTHQELLALARLLTRRDR
ncbi:polyprenyl synthetase family protein [Actinoplanes sp. NPDC051494]|uniref:polyprenyl synthetase family protein n=1 Tax=Actinoplanes sp. NPDC051494 TaxID=3363907 RepID=UPI003799946B